MRNVNFVLNVYEKKNFSSKLVTQLLYGESFKIEKIYPQWIKIKSKYDNYVGYVKRKKFKKDLANSHKVNKLKANIYKKPHNSFKLKNNISFCSLLKITERKKNFFKFDNYWIKKKDIDPINKKIKILSKIKIFKGIKYKWGGKSFKGIDCSALIQIFYKYNNFFCPRDTIDQIKFFIKKNTKKNKNFKKNDLIFWKGHVAICLDSKKLIHAYGPKKKVLIMPIKSTIAKIEKTANLKIKKICTINTIT